FLFFAYKIIIDKTFLPVPLIIGIICTLMLFFWIFIINPKWIKIAADAYAERLICALDIL
ncbi:MAG: hypothetical protein ABSA74_01035, partial [Candidatus Staskawiczbacteria bacterium]